MLGSNVSINNVKIHPGDEKANQRKCLSGWWSELFGMINMLMKKELWVPFYVVESVNMIDYLSWKA